MKKLIFLFILLLFKQLVFSRELEYARSIVARLASPELKGRGFTQNGHKLAEDYIVEEFKKMNLAPVGKSWFQKFDISVNTFPGKMEFKIGGQLLQPGIDYLVEASTPTIKGKFTEDKELNKKVDEFISVLKYSPQVSCKGIIVYSKDKLTWDAATEQTVRPVIITNKECDLTNNNKIELNIEADFVKKCTTQNIIGCLKGSLKPDSFIVVLAHYDHLGEVF